MPITDDNRHLLRSAYEARNRNELPVLVRWFEGVVGWLYTDTPAEIPMAPITMMRNALGVER